MKLVEDRLDDTFVAANGDVFVSMDVSGEIDIHRSTGAAVTIALTPVDNPWPSTSYPWILLPSDMSLGTRSLEKS